MLTIVSLILYMQLIYPATVIRGNSPSIIISMKILLILLSNRKWCWFVEYSIEVPYCLCRNVNTFPPCDLIHHEIYWIYRKLVESSLWIRSILLIFIIRLRSLFTMKLKKVKAYWLSKLFISQTQNGLMLVTLRVHMRGEWILNNIISIEKEEDLT